MEDDNVSTGLGGQSFAPIPIPKCKSFAQKDVQDFIIQREAYEEACAHQAGITAVPYRMCFNAGMLRSFVRSRFFGAAVKQVSDLTDAILKAKLAERSGKKLKFSKEQVSADVKRNVRLNANESDAEFRIESLSASYLDLCDQRGWDFVEKTPKAAVKHIISVLQPPRLKEEAESAIDLLDENLKKDYFAFIDFLKKEAVTVERFIPLREYRQSQKNNRETPKPTGKNADLPKPSGGKAKTTTNQNGNGPGGGWNNNTSTTTSDTPPKRLPKCLKPGCNKYNYLAKCHPEMPKEQQDKLVSDYKAKKAAEKAADNSKAKVGAIQKSSGGTSDNTSPPKPISTPDESSVIQCSLNGFKFSCRIDSGSDAVACISDTIVDFLFDKGIFLPIRMYTEPHIYKAFDGRVVEAKGEAQISPLLYTDAGPCRLRNVQVKVAPNSDGYVSPGNDCAGEIVLGNPLLKRMGLDVKQFLADNIGHVSSIDFSGNPSEDPPDKVGKLGQKLCENSRLGKVGSLQYNNPFPLKDDDDIKYKDVDVGEQDEDELQEAIQKMIDRATESLPDHLHKNLKDLVGEFKDIFRIKLGNDPPVDVPPMKIEFEESERPVKVRQRTYSPEQTEFLKKKVQDFSDAGFIERNNTSKWASAPLVVPKPGEEGFRFTVDLRPVNAQTKNAVWPMPNADAMLGKLVGSKVWFKLDFIHGYWQFPLSEESRECQSFHTPFGVYTPNRVLHGATNAVTYFQSSMESLFGHLDLLVYLDDILGYETDAKKLLSKLRAVFTLCRDKNLKLSPDKCHLVTHEVKFCGRIISKHGVKFNPRQYDAITNMQPPTAVGELMQLVHGANWMRTAIPDFARLITPLHDLLESEYTKHGTRKKSRLANRPISAWGEEHGVAFVCLIQAIEEQATLATPDPKKRLCLFTDASELHWSGVLTQVTTNEFYSGDKPGNWNHYPIAFVSGSFRGSSMRWTMPEKESYAIVSSVIRLSHILVVCSEFSIFTDHKNLLYMLSPTRFSSNVARHVVHKVQRWAIRLAEFNFVVEHIPGEDNVWADILTRWAAPGYDKSPARRISAIKVPLITEDLPELPSAQAIMDSQKKFPPPKSGWKKVLLRQYSSESEIWANDDGKWYVPPEDEELQLRIVVAAHCGLGGHRGYTTTCNVIKDKLTWETVDDDVKAFVQGCLVCLLSDSGMKVPRPLGQQVHASKVGELLHFDYLYVGESTDEKEYILILKDDFSGYVYLRACAHADAETTANVLVEYFTTFVPVLQWFSDQGTHFKNEVMELLAKDLGVRHHFSTAYVPWSNGTVESVCKQTLRVMRAFSHECQIEEADWTKTVPAIQSIINNTPARRLGNRAPVTVHTGMDAGNPLDLALTSLSYKDAFSVDEVRIKQTMDIELLQNALDNMHKEVAATLDATRKKAIERHNAKTHVKTCILSVGDYVVVARFHGARTKMSANWVGPRRIVQTLSDYIYRVENLLTKTTEDIHISRIKHYADALVGTAAQMKEIAEFSDRVWYSVNNIKNVRKEKGQFEALVAWKGLTDRGDSWEPLQVMYEDVPSKVRAYFKDKRKTKIMEAAKKSIGL